MAVTEPDPSQVDWDGYGPFADDAYALPPSAGVPVEWADPHPWEPEIAEMKDGYRTPEALYLEVPPGSPRTEQLPPAIEALSGDLLTLGTIPLTPDAYTDPETPWSDPPDPWVPESWVNRAGDPWQPPGGDRPLYPLHETYMTPGMLRLWRIRTDWTPPDDADDPEPPDPEPPEPGERVDAVLTFAGLPDSEATRATIQQHLEIVTAQVRAYVRGNGFAAGYPSPDLEAVIISAAARSAVNPTGAARLSFGELRTEPGIYNGFTLPELAILHSYRRRWA